MCISKDKPKNIYLVAIKLNKSKQNISAMISEVLNYDFVSIFSISKQENIQLRDLININPEKYFLQNLNPIKIYEAQLDEVDNEKYLSRITNSIYHWEENEKNKIKVIDKNLGSPRRYERSTYSIIKESEFDEKHISSFLFSDKSEYKDLRSYDEKKYRNEDDEFRYYSKIIYTKDLSPHLILNFGTFYNVWANPGLGESSGYNTRKKLSEIIEEKFGFNWKVDDEYDLSVFMSIIEDFDLYNNLNQNSYGKWLRYKNLVGLEDYLFYEFFDFYDFIIFYESENDQIEKLIKSPNLCTKKRECQFCNLMTHIDVDVCYHCNYNENLNLYNKLDDKFISEDVRDYFELINTNKEIQKLIYQMNYYKTELNDEYKKAQKWYKFYRINEHKINAKSENKRIIDSLKKKIEDEEKILDMYENLFKQRKTLNYLKKDLSEVIKGV